MRAEENRAFDTSWRTREEAGYGHFTRGAPNNQVQLAFRRHWLVLQNLMANPRFAQGRRVLEVGCGRGSLSCYFADAGFDCTLLDLSPAVLEVARSLFSRHQLEARFVAGDAEALPFGDESFDLVFSIGLLEHFSDPRQAVEEQLRVLAPGGLFFGYVVPDYHGLNVQGAYAWVNELLTGYAAAPSEKQELYRRDAGSEAYLPVLEQAGLVGVGSSGIYSVPMISHSPTFPFSLMPPSSERALVKHLEGLLEARACRTGADPWLCEEGFGQAFAVWGYRK